MSTTGQPDVPDDDAVLGDLRRAFELVDPPPADLVDAGRNLFALRRLDDELAELVGDSRADALATRDAVGLERMVSFAAGAVTIDVQLTAQPGGTVELLGEIDPAPQGARVVVEGLEATVLAEAVPDAGGRFVVTLPAVGAVRLRLVRRTGPAVTSPWFAL